MNTCLIFICIIAYSKIVYVVIGPTGVGKSSLINYLANDTLIKVTNEKASSTQCSTKYTVNTSHIYPYSTIFIDTQGLIDTQSNDQEVMRNISNTIIHQIWVDPTSEFKFLLVFSASDYRIHIIDTIAFLHKALGTDFLNSTLVILTKLYFATLEGNSVESIKKYITDEVSKHYSYMIPIATVETKFMKEMKINNSQQLENVNNALTTVQPFVSSFTLEQYDYISNMLLDCFHHEIDQQTANAPIKSLFGHKVCFANSLFSRTVSQILKQRITKQFVLYISRIEQNLTYDMKEEYNKWMMNGERTMNQRITFLHNLLTTMDKPSWLQKARNVVNRIGSISYNYLYVISSKYQFFSPEKLDTATYWVSSAFNATSGLLEFAFDEAYWYISAKLDDINGLINQTCEYVFANITQQCQASILEKLNIQLTIINK